MGEGASLIQTISVSKYRAKLEKQQSKIASTLSAMKVVPAIEVCKLFDRVEVLHSTMINPMATNARLVHLCTCCDDSVLLAMPYRLIDGVEVYTTPPMMVVGNRYEHGSGDVMVSDLDKVFEEFGVTLTAGVREDIENHFKNHPATEFRTEDY